jgi:hypothetical protein
MSFSNDALFDFTGAALLRKEAETPLTETEFELPSVHVEQVDPSSTRVVPSISVATPIRDWTMQSSYSE